MRSKPSSFYQNGNVKRGSAGLALNSTDGYEEDEAQTEDLPTVLTYPSSTFDREQMLAAIKSGGKRELMREARIAMRTIDAAWAGREVADADLKRMADAAERIVNGYQKRNDESAFAVGWLKARRDEIGLAALAERLRMDTANLGKVIVGKRKPSVALLSKIAAVRSRKE